MISVVIPVYNEERYLGSCLNALIEQILPPDEIIVVDDGSTDNSLQIANKYPVRVISQKHHGPAAARNIGIQNANGEIILFTDADCRPTVNWVQEMVQPFLDATIVGVKGVYATNQQNIVARIIQYEFEERYDMMSRLTRIDFVDTYSAAFRADVLRQVGGFDRAFPHANNEDVDLSYRLARLGNKMVFNRNAVVFHHHVERWGDYINLKIKRAYWRMIVYRLHPSKIFKDTYTPQLLKLQVVFAALTPMLLILGLFRWPILCWGSIATGIGLLVSAFPFVLKVYNKESQLLVWAFFLVILRAYAFSIGVIAGVVGLFFFHRNKERSALP